MKSQIVYCSHSGITKQLAEAIGDALAPRGTVEVVPVASAAPMIGADVDLLLIGSPTEAHGIPAEMRRFLDAIPADSVRGRAAAAFDTRLDWPRLLSGSAADGIAKQLTAKGARVADAHGSFIVTKEPGLAEGELERARAWATTVADALAPVTA